MTNQCKDSIVDPEFMLRYMRYAKITGVFANFTSQTSIAHLTQEKLAAVEMFAPKKKSKTEQNRMIERFKIVDQIIGAGNNKLKKLKKQKSGLMHDLLTGKVPVTVDEIEADHDK